MSGALEWRLETEDYSNIIATHIRWWLNPSGCIEPTMIKSVNNECAVHMDVTHGPDASR